MNGDIKEMVTKHIQVIKMIIKSEGKEGDKTAGIISPNVLDILDIFYSKIVDYVKKVIEME